MSTESEKDIPQITSSRGSTESMGHAHSIVDTTPRKLMLWNGVATCSTKNAVTELQDNLLDFVVERHKKDSLGKSDILSEFSISPKEVRIKWNLGVPNDRRLAMLTPGMHMSEDKESVGTWSVGGKIAIHALGDDIRIKTCCPEDDSVSVYHYPSGWLRDSSGNYNEEEETNWRVVKKVEKIEDDTDFTEIIIKNPSDEIRGSFDANLEENYRDSMNRILEYVGETYGLAFKEMEGKGVYFSMKINDEPIKPITFSSMEDIEENMAIVPGFEPAMHEYKLKDLDIKILVGCTSRMDAGNGGMYFYGSHNRRFASRERNSSYITKFDLTHPQRKHWQMHIFMTGDTNLIPWSSPLKDGVNYGHQTMDILKPILNKLPLPYIELVMKTHAPERRVFSKEYRTWNEDTKRALFDFKNITGDTTKISDEEWNSLPSIARTGRPFNENIIESYDHGDVLESLKERVTRKGPKWSENMASKWLKSKKINQGTTKTIQDKIDALWALNEFIDPKEERPIKDPNDDVPDITPTGTETGSDPTPEDDLPDDTEATVPDEDVDDEGEKEVLSARIYISDKVLISKESGSERPVDNMQFLIDLFHLNKELLKVENLPDDITSADNMINKMRALIDHLKATGKDDTAERDDSA